MKVNEMVPDQDDLTIEVIYDLRHSRVLSEEQAHQVMVYLRKKGLKVVPRSSTKQFVQDTPLEIHAVVERIQTPGKTKS